MATTSTITALATLSSVQSDDVLPIVDVHDTTQAPSGSTKKLTVATLLAGYLPLAGGTLTGTVTLPNTVAVLGRNAANTGNVTLVYADASNQVNVSAGNTILLNGSTQIAGPLTFDTDGGRDIGNVGTNRPRNIYVAGAIAAASLSTSGSATVGGTFNVTGTATLAGTFFHSGTSVGFYGAGASTQQSVTGSRTGKDALALQLLACLAQLGLVANNTTP